jgi:hypothetical protein
VEQLGDAHTGHHRFDGIGECASLRRDTCLYGRDVQAIVAKFDTLQVALPQPASEALQPTVQFDTLHREPFVRRRRQAELRRGGGHGDGWQEIAFELAIAG